MSVNEEPIAADHSLPVKACTKWISPLSLKVDCSGFYAPALTANSQALSANHPTRSETALA